MAKYKPFRVAFDIETNGFRYNKIHSLVLADLDTGNLYSFCNQPGYPPISQGLALLEQADLVIGHNIIGFDLPAILKLHRIKIPREKVRDTLILSRVLWPDLRESDSLIADMPAKLQNKHSLAAWGWRLEGHKDLFAETTDWQTWTRDMQDHCETDVVVTVALWLKIVEEQNAREVPDDTAADSHADPFVMSAGMA